MSIDQLVQTQLQMAQAFGGLNDTLNNTPTMEVSTRDVAATLEVPAAVTTISIGGVTTVGDGQSGQYIRVAADPGAVEKFQSADGSWFQLVTPTSLAASTTVSSGTSISAATFVAAGTTISSGGAISADTTVSAGSTMNAGTGYQVAGTQVAGARITGWGTAVTVDRSGFNSATVTLPELAQRVAALITDLKTHGLIGT